MKASDLSPVAKCIKLRSWVKNSPVVTKGERGRDKFGINRWHCYIQKKKQQELLHSTGNAIQYLLITYQFSSVPQSCPTLCGPMNHSTPGLLVHHQLPESTQTHVHQVRNAIQLSHSPLSPSPPAVNLSQHEGLFKWVSSSHQVAKVLEPQLQHQSFQWIFRTDFL